MTTSIMVITTITSVDHAGRAAPRFWNATEACCNAPAGAPFTSAS
jgi:hypothetical protein